MNYLWYAAFWILHAIDKVIDAVLVFIDRRFAQCQPDSKFGTFVWHRHKLFGRDWITAHNILDDGSEWREFV